MSVERSVDRGARDEESARSRPARILVVDDNPDVREILGLQLRSAGYEVHCSADGASGFEALDRLNPDLVIVDIMMPGIDGLELCRRMRGSARHRRRSIMVLSARTDTRDRIKGLELGADDYLIKPVSTNELLARVRRKLEANEALQSEIERERQAAIGELAVAVCHEVNNPLFALLGEIQLALADETLEGEERERFERLESLALRMTEVLGRVSAARDVATRYVGDVRMTDLWAR